MSRQRAPRGRGSARRPRKHRWTGHLRQRLSPPPCPRVVGDRQQHFLWRFSRNSSRQNTGNGAEDATRPSRGSLPRPPEAAQCAPFAALRRSSAAARSSHCASIFAGSRSCPYATCRTRFSRSLRFQDTKSCGCTAQWPSRGIVPHFSGRTAAHRSMIYEGLSIFA